MQKTETVLITGGSGLIGQRLRNKLISEGYKVAVLSRSKNSDDTSETKVYQWDINNKRIDSEAVENADHIVHLAGVNIGEKRWSAKRKEEILNSRIEPAELLIKALTESENEVKTLISMSASGYYGGITSEKIFVESDPPGNDFLGSVCREWEESISPVESLKIRLVKLRTGIVLTKDGGALKRMITPFRLGLGTHLGSGKQYMPWIHIDDLCKLIIATIRNDDMSDVFNVASPQHINNKEFSKTLSKVLNKAYLGLPVPSIMLKIVFGEMASIILEGSRISCQKLLDTGFEFEFPELEEALKDLL